MPKASDLTADKNISFLFKGPFGFGKTLAAASFALVGPVWIGYFDKQKPVELMWFKQFGALGKKILQNIDYDVYSGSNSYQYLNKIIDFTSRCDYSGAIITDSVTNLTASAVNWSLGFRDQKNRKTDKVNKDAPAIIPEWDEYKVETSMVSQALDLSKKIPTNVIWIAHPLPGIKIEGTGASVKVTKVNPIVTYGSKVAGMIPGNFTEIYNFSKLSGWDSASGKSHTRYLVDFQAIGDEYAKTGVFDSSITQIDITDRLFYQVWLEQVKLQNDRNEKLVELIPAPDPTDTNPIRITNPFKTNQPSQPSTAPLLSGYTPPGKA